VIALWIALAFVLLFMLSLILWALVRQNRSMEGLLALEDRRLFFREVWRMMNAFPGPYWPRGDRSARESGEARESSSREGRPGWEDEDYVREFRQHYLNDVRKYSRMGLLIIVASLLLPFTWLLTKESGRDLLWGAPSHLFATCLIFMLLLALIVSIVAMMRRGTELIFKVEGKMALMLEPPLEEEQEEGVRSQNEHCAEFGQAD
jgi:hypothetical protein